MNISELLFAVKEEVRCCRDGSGAKYFVGDTFSEYRSSARPKTAAARTAKSKLNAVALLMDAMLVDKKIFIGTINEGEYGYAEYHDNETIFAAICDGNQIVWLNRNIPSNRAARLAPLFAFALGANAGDNHTYKEFCGVVNFANIFDNKCSVALVTMLCDAFYYEFVKSAFDDIPEDVKMTKTEFDRIVKKGKVSYLPDLLTIGMRPTYINVDKDAPIKIMGLKSYTIPMYGNSRLMPYGTLEVEMNGKRYFVDIKEEGAEQYVTVNRKRYYIINIGGHHNPNFILKDDYEEMKKAVAKAKRVMYEAMKEAFKKCGVNVDDYAAKINRVINNCLNKREKELDSSNLDEKYLKQIAAEELLNSLSD